MIVEGSTRFAREEHLILRYGSMVFFYNYVIKVLQVNTSSI